MNALQPDETTDPLAWIDDDAQRRADLGLDRRLVVHGRALPGRLTRDGREFLNFATNDYLGLAADPRVVAAVCQAAERFGWGAGGSGLVCGWREPHEALAAELADFEGTEAAVVFPTGYAANLGTIVSLLGPEDAVYADRLNHSCLIEGARLARATLRIYPHGDANRLETILRRERGRFRRLLIATDGVFSMDGDLAPLPALADLAHRFDAMLLVDEAHGTGVLGPNGRGAADALGVSDRIPVKVGTLSKALGSIGGFVAGSKRLIDHLVNRAPTLIYSTALPPAAAAAASEALRIAREETWRRERLSTLGSRLRSTLRNMPEFGNAAMPMPTTPIVPWVVGESERALKISALLREKGLFVPAIRPPTVPAGTARLRISLTAAHTDTDLETLIAALSEAIAEPPDRLRDTRPLD